MSILIRMQQQQVAAKDGPQPKVENLNQDIKAQVQGIGNDLAQNGVSQPKEAGYNGQVVKPQERRQEPPTQEV